MEIFKIIFWHDLKVKSKSKVFLLSNFLYFLIFLTIISILSNKILSSNQYDVTLISVILSLIVSLIANCNNFLNQDFVDGTLEQILVKYNYPEFIFLAKVIANWVQSSFLISLFSTIYLYFNSDASPNFLLLLLVFLALSLTLSLIFSFASLVSLCADISFIGVIISLPLSIPTILISKICLTENFTQNFLTLLAISFLILISSCVSSGKILKILHQ